MKTCPCGKEIAEKYILCYRCQFKRSPEQRKKVWHRPLDTAYEPPPVPEKNLPPPNPDANPYHLSAQKRRSTTRRRLETS